MRRRYIILLLMLVLGQVCNSQTISGVVKDSSGELLVGVNVYSKEFKTGTTTDFDGVFELKVPSKMTDVTVSYLGYYEYVLKLNSNQNSYDIVLTEDNTQLQEVLVLGKTKSEVLREQAYSVVGVETKDLKNMSTDVNEILGKISGINIRESGGLGSEFSYSLNGLSGNQVKIFINGIPMDYFGSSLSLNNFPANIVEMIEVYKGVVPIHLSSDALGGAINIITNSKIESFLDVSYSIASYSTHRFALNGQYRNTSSGVTIRAKSFYNYSDNNYRVPVKLINPDTGKENENATMVERFHDGYESKMFWVEGGVTKNQIADELMVGVMYSDNFKEIQQAENAIGIAKIPYGEVAKLEQKVITNLSFKKNGLLNDKLNISSYLVSVLSEEVSRDTSSYKYDWFQNKTLQHDTSVGEIEQRKTLLKLNKRNYLANLNGDYAFSNYHNLALNYSFNYLNLKGTDDFKEQNATQFKNPSQLVKQVVGLSYSNSLSNARLKNVLFSKYYNYKNSSVTTGYSGLPSQTTPIEVNKDYLGVGAASTYKFDFVQIKASYENAIRFPEVVEIYGDGLSIYANPELLPEQTNNYNLGLSLNKKPFTLALDFFVRDIDNYILPVVEGIKVTYKNTKSVLSKGVDFSASTNFKRQLFLVLNGTYLDKRDNQRWENDIVGGKERSTYNQRVPNEPYLFGNAVVSYKGDELFNSQDKYGISFTQGYVHEFHYNWENQGSSNKPIVPEQWTSDIEFVYSMKKEKYNISFRVSNVWDATVYDNYLQQKPGRMFHVKLRYFIN